jgi:adenylate cyclase
MKPAASATGKCCDPRRRHRRYSFLMEADGTGTLARLKTHRLELMDPAIAKNKGPLIKIAREGMLVECSSVA